MSLADLTDVLTSTPQPPWLLLGTVLVFAFVATSLVAHHVTKGAIAKEDRVAVSFVAAAIALLVTFFASFAVLMIGHDHDEQVAIAQYLADEYDLVALSPIDLRDESANLTARTSNGHDIDVIVMWPDLDEQEQTVEAFLPDATLPASRDDIDAPLPVRVLIDGTETEPGPVVWDFDKDAPREAGAGARSTR